MSTFAKYPPMPTTGGGGVTSVNGQVGVVILTATDLGLGPTDNVTFGSVTANNLIANRAVVTDAAKKLVSSATTDTEIGFVAGVTSSIQTQLNGKQATGNYITALTGDVTATGPGSVAATLALVGTAGTYVKVTTDTKGRVTSGSASPLGPTDGGTGLTSYVTGDTLYASATNVLSKLPIGTDGQELKTISGIPAWQDWIDPTSETKLFEDWLSDGAGQIRWLGTPVGAGATNTTGTTVATNNHPGVLELQTGTTATGQAARYLGGVATGTATAGFVVGGGAISHSWLIRLEDLSTGTERYNFDVGLFGVQTLAVDAIRIRYSDNLFAGNFGLETISASTSTSIDSGITVAADTWYNLRMDINAAGTSVGFYINGTLVGTNTTNIPTVVIAPRCRIIKSIGTTNRNAYVDYFKLYQRFTTPRG